MKSIYSTSEKKLKTPRNVDDIIQKIRQERKEVSSESRYEVVNCSRGLKEDEADKGHYDLVDLQPRESTEEEQCQYAYDLYTSAKKDFDISMLEDLVWLVFSCLSILDYKLANLVFFLYSTVDKSHYYLKKSNLGT